MSAGASDGHAAEQAPQPLHRAGLTLATNFSGSNVMAPKGQTLMHPMHPEHRSGMIWETMPPILMFSIDRTVTALAAAACAWVMDSSRDLGA